MYIETLVHERQQAYYDALRVADSVADSSSFVEFMLTAIRDSLKDLLNAEQVREQVTDQVERLLEALKGHTLSSKELMERLGLRHRPTFRDRYLLPAMKS